MKKFSKTYIFILTFASGNKELLLRESRIAEEKYIMQKNEFEYDKSNGCSNIKLFAYNTEKTEIINSFMSAKVYANGPNFQNGYYSDKLDNENAKQIGLIGTYFDCYTGNNNQKELSQCYMYTLRDSFISTDLFLHHVINTSSLKKDEPLYYNCYSEDKKANVYWMFKYKSDNDTEYSQWINCGDLKNYFEDVIICNSETCVMYVPEDIVELKFKCFAFNRYSSSESEEIEVSVNNEYAYSDPKSVAVSSDSSAIFSVGNNCEYCNYEWEYCSQYIEQDMGYINPNSNTWNKVSELLNNQNDSSELQLSDCYDKIAIRCHITPCFNHTKNVLAIFSEYYNNLQFVYSKDDFKYLSSNHLDEVICTNPSEIGNLTPYYRNVFYFTDNSSGYYTKAAILDIIPYWDNLIPISETCSSVELAEIDGYEYSSDGENWQTEATFNELVCGRRYTFFRRLSGMENFDYSTMGNKYEYTPQHHFNTYGYCRDCGNIQNGTEAFVSANAAVGGKIGMNFKVALSAEAAADSESRMEFTMESGNVICIPKSQATMVDSSKNIYQFTLSLTSTQMDEKVTAQMKYSEGFTYPNGAQPSVLTDYSVNKYLDNIEIEATKQNDTKLLDVISAMRNFGAYMDIYTGDNISDITPTDLSNTAVSVDNNYSAVVEGTVEGVTAKSAALTVNSLIDIAVKFSVDGNIENYTFKVDNQEVTPVLIDGLYWVKINEISPKDYSRMYNVSVTDGQSTMSVKYSALSYVKNKLNDADQNLVNVCKAMYLYNKAMTAYTN